MKTSGAILEFTHQRNSDIMRVFRHHLSSQPHIFLPDILVLVAKSPASRFWVSEERAAIVISALIAGRPLPPMRDNKKEMFAEILRRYLEIKDSRPGESLANIVADIVNQPAPRFYLTPRTIGTIINRINNGFYGK
ncbi:MAG: hypothetical protein J1E16_04125 [Muribaculaceae bacterium]|nr:hypothetical protein [Muribaculaceae bacterium]